MPGSFNNEPPGVSVTSLGDSTLGAALASGVLTWNEPKIGADCSATQTSPVTNLNGQGESSQRGDPPETRQVIADLRIFTVSGHADDCLIQDIKPVHGSHYCLVIGIKRHLQG